MNSIAHGVAFGKMSEDFLLDRAAPRPRKIQYSSLASSDE
jgi:hypothetical protein